MLRKGAGARQRAGNPAPWAAPPAFAAAMLIAATAVLVAAGCSPPPKLHRVTIRSFRFEPATLTVAPGDTVQWDNQDVVPHTATSGQVFDSASIAAGGSWRWVATGKDSLAYQCTYHVNMKAALIVR